MDLYRERAERYGYTASDDQLGWAVPVYVGETDQAAMSEAKPHFENFRNRFAKMPIEFLLPPGYTSRESMKRVAAAKKSMFGDITLEAAMDLGMMVCGSAATVREVFAEHHRRLGFGNLLTMLQFGTLPEDLTDANMDRFANEVMPAMKALGPSERHLEHAPA